MVAPQLIDPRRPTRQQERTTRGPNDGVAGPEQGGQGMPMPKVPTSLAAASPDAQAQKMVPKVNTRGLVPKSPGVPGAPQAPQPPAAQAAQAAPVARDREGNPLPGVSGRLNTLLDSESPYLARARTRGKQFANRRGLLNSSIAAGATESAAIDAALPIAQGDADIAARTRAIRSQELMQTRGLDHDAAQQEASRELQDLLQTRDHRVQQLMQTEQLSHDAAQQEANRELQSALTSMQLSAQRAMQTESFQFAGTQAELDRESRRSYAVADGMMSINSEYQRNLTVLASNTRIPAEERKRLEEHYAFLRDQQLQAIEATYEVDLPWESTRQPEDEEV